VYCTTLHYTPLFLASLGGIPLSKVVQTRISDGDVDDLQRAADKAGETQYEFAKKAIMDRAASVLAADDAPLVMEMVLALNGRKRYIYQIVDFADRNHIEWLKSRFPRARPRQLQVAISTFRNGRK